MGRPPRLAQFLTHQVIVVDVNRFVLPAFHSDLAHIGLVPPPRLRKWTRDHLLREVDVGLYYWICAAAEKSKEVSVRLFRDVFWLVVLLVDSPRVEHWFIVRGSILLVRMFSLLM